MTIRVVVADDQDVVRAGLAALVAQDGDIEVVSQAGDGLTAVRAVAETDPDVVLMDIRMPGIDGIEATRRIVGSGCTARVLVLTTFGLDAYVFEAVRAGASGFLLKDVPADRLREAVRVLARGDALLDPAVTRALVEEFARLPGRAGGPLPDPGVSDREREVLVLVAQGLTNAQIGARLFVSENTVRTHVSRMLAKLGLRDRVQLVVHAYDTGIVRPRER